MRASQSAYKKRVAEGKRGKGKRRRYYGEYFRDDEVDTLIAEVAERLVKPEVKDDALLLERIRRIERSDHTTEEEDEALTVQAIEWLVRNVKNLFRK